MVDEKTLAIIEYCKPHREQMWAARILGILLDCDFRDVEHELQRKGFL